MDNMDFLLKEAGLEQLTEEETLQFNGGWGGKGKWLLLAWLTPIGIAGALVVTGIYVGLND